MVYDPTCVLDLPYMSGLSPSLGGTDGAIRDRSGHGNHAFPVNFAGMPGGATNVEFVDGNLGQQIYMATTEYLTLGVNADFDFTVQDFTIETWCLPNTSGISRIIFHNYAWNTDGYRFVLDAGNRMEFRTFQAAANQFTQGSVGTGIGDGNLHQYVAARNGPTIRLYRDGNEVAYAAVGVHINPLPATLRTANIWNTLIGYGARCRVWNRLLGAAEIHNRFVNRMRV